MHPTSLNISFLWGDSLVIFYDVSLCSSGWNMPVKQATGMMLDPLNQKGACR